MDWGLTIGRLRVDVGEVSINQKLNNVGGVAKNVSLSVLAANTELVCWAATINLCRISTPARIVEFL